MFPEIAQLYSQTIFFFQCTTSYNTTCSLAEPFLSPWCHTSGQKGSMTQRGRGWLRESTRHVYSTVVWTCQISVVVSGVYSINQQLAA